MLTENDLLPSRPLIAALRKTLNEVIFGKTDLIDLVLVGLFARGHMLLEGLPGLGKTELVKGLSKTLQLQTRRIQFTPDLLPGDITGNPILQETAQGRQFVFTPGPIFTNFVLADEINRASPKTQSALLEAMQERRVTVLGETHILPDPFFVLATQNPIELEGTYPLPEAQLDRFLFKVEVLRNDANTLERIVKDRELGVEPTVEAVLSHDQLADLHRLTRQIFLPDVVANYIARIVDASHHGQSAAAAQVKFGASPRAALSLASAVKARAMMEGRLNASFEDVAALALPVLNHRIILDYAAKIAGRTTAHVVADILKEVPARAAALPKSLTQVSE
jgi:MoxR-like ATPase